MGYSIESITEDCYEGTSCLINKFGIKDEEKLRELEGAIVLAKIAEFEGIDINRELDFNYYKFIHRFLFEDLYEWAGQIRTINFSKKGTRFVDCEKIEATAEKIFLHLKTEHFFSNQPRDRFIENLVDFYCATNWLHPFREGNGRTQRVFITKLLQHNGYDINFSNTDTDELMIATIHASNGVKDFLMNFFEQNIICKQ